MSYFGHWWKRALLTWGSDWTGRDLRMVPISRLKKVPWIISETEYIFISWSFCVLFNISSINRVFHQWSLSPTSSLLHPVKAAVRRQGPPRPRQPPAGEEHLAHSGRLPQPQGQTTRGGLHSESQPVRQQRQPADLARPDHVGGEVRHPPFHRAVRAEVEAAGQEVAAGEEMRGTDEQWWCACKNVQRSFCNRCK